MLKLLVACANGAGTSLMMKMSVERATKDLNMAISEIHHCSLSEGKGCAINYNVVFCPLNFIDMFKDAQAKGITIIGLRNVLSDAEVKEKLKETGLVEKHQK